MFDFSTLKKTISDLSSGVAAKRSEIETLKQQRETLATAPGTREDILDLLFKQIEGESEHYATRLQESITKHLRYGIGREIGPQGKPVPAAVATARDNLARPAAPGDIESSLCFLMRDQLKAAMEKAVKAMDWPVGAEPIKGREKRLADLDKKIAALEAEVKSLREDAATAGILV